jgi:hypothetical protein
VDLSDREQVERQGGEGFGGKGQSSILCSRHFTLSFGSQLECRRSPLMKTENEGLGKFSILEKLYHETLNMKD